MQPKKQTEAMSVARTRLSNEPDPVDGRGAVTLDRGLQVLFAFSREDPRMSLTMLSEKTGINKATLLRFLESLKRNGLIEQNHSGLFYVGPAALVLFGLHRAATSEDEIIRLTLEALVEKSGESASYSIHEGDRRIVAFRVQSRHRIRDHVEVGDSFPIGIGAPGLAIKAFLNDEGGVTEQVRNQCFAVTHGEIEPDATAVAVPVFKGRSVVGALAITGPANRITSDRIGEFVPLLLDAAVKLTMRMEGDYTRLQAALRASAAQNAI